MQQFINSCINANGAWPLVALAALLIGFVLNRRVKSGLLTNSATQANTVSVKGNDLSIQAIQLLAKSAVYLGLQHDLCQQSINSLLRRQPLQSGAFVEKPLTSIAQTPSGRLTSSHASLPRSQQGSKGNPCNSSSTHASMQTGHGPSLR